MRAWSQCRRFLAPENGAGRQKTAPFSGGRAVVTMRRFPAPFSGAGKRWRSSAEDRPPFSGAVFWMCAYELAQKLYPKTRWENLRDQYWRKKQRPSTGSTPTTKWPYLDELRFLDKTREESDLRDSTGSDFFDEEDVFKDRPQSSLAASMTHS
ncbi:alcohol dehydrogenase transcription factor myb/SANT-like domain-containing protein [Ditylenchus destructor]|nr:alcohol dehydrogenase transcription factor myb/SANT-like domain-containing protein [Ditylenchus destructor]